MAFGGIPYYLNYLKPQYSVAQNIDNILLAENAPLRYEYENLFSSLFKNARHQKSTPGVQVDLLIDRKDGVINLCEVKYTEDEFAIDAAYEKELMRKVEVLRLESGTKKAVLLTMITQSGLKNNACKGSVVAEIVADDLFEA